MKKGFTLMELLAVLLVIAVVVSMAAPVFRAVRYEIKNSQAKNAAKKMAEAMHSYYQASRGYTVKDCFTPTAAAGLNVIKTAASACSSPGATGIPASSSGGSVSVSQLFACGYLSYKDFMSLPYEFCANDTESFPSGWGTKPSTSVGKVYVLAGGVKADGSGDKYQKSKGVIFVDARMVAQDTY
ncbi:MAG: prepilin-type N-terminal cleavage/methylation domain-containing protein [Elusimicrobia bacterium]|nr:prepilin-type N-terminal cleavage/methylation domain-containing protein [Elusimicrobiota bacterium]MDY6039773.1 prepilin-type N-terminal cleavage/methylation domain-containing protein [Elusimicrobiaceae bacterium]